jgi:hypothetical protein
MSLAPVSVSSGAKLSDPDALNVLRELARAWVGMLAAAAFIKRALPLRGDEESDELSLVAVFDGIDLKSRAKGFRGGSMLAWFGGINVDLRDAELAPGARLTAHTLFGGIALQTPPGWRVESSAKALSGGVDIRTSAQDDPDAPVLTLEGMVIFGGIAVAGRANRATDTT